MVHQLDSSRLDLSSFFYSLHTVIVKLEVLDAKLNGIVCSIRTYREFQKEYIGLGLSLHKNKEVISFTFEGNDYNIYPSHDISNNEIRFVL